MLRTNLEFIKIWNPVPCIMLIIWKESNIMDNERYLIKSSSPQNSGTTEPTLPITIPQSDLSPKNNKKNYRMGLFIGGAIIILIAVGVIVSSVVALVDHSSSDLVKSVANDYCQSLIQKDYGKLYQQFASQLQTIMTQDAYTDSSQGIDDRQGYVTSCDWKTITVSKDEKTATSSGTITRKSAGDFDLSFIKDGSSWKINKLHDIGLYPLAATFQLCKDLQLQKYDDAYKLLTSSFQQQLGSSAKLSQLAGPLQPYVGAFKGCTIQGLVVSTDKSSGKVSAGIDFTLALAQDLPGIFELASQSFEVWKINSIQVSTPFGNIALPLPDGLTLPSGN
jgi:hypothetical protein